MFAFYAVLLLNGSSDAQNVSVPIVDPSFLFLVFCSLLPCVPLLAFREKACVASVKRIGTSLIIKKIVKLLLHEI